MNTISQSRLAARMTLAAGLALFGAAAAAAQTSGTSTTSGTSSTSGARAGDDTYERQTNASTSGAAAGSYGTQSDATRADQNANRRDRRSDRSSSSAYDTTGTTSSTGSVAGRDDDNRRDKLSFGDRRFVTKTADSGQSEVALAQLAAERASNPEVKSFAERLVKDHTTVNQELMGLASTKNVKLDTDDDKDRHYKRMAKKSGAEFDEEFLEHMVESHENSVKNFEKASRDAKDSEVRAFASKHLDPLREHLSMAQNLRSSVMPTGRIDSDTDTTGAARTDAGTSSATATGTSGTSSTDTSGTSSSATDSTSSGVGTGTSGTTGSGSDTRRGGTGR